MVGLTRRWAVFAVLLAVLAACAKPPPIPPPKPPLVVPARNLEISIQADAGVNPDARNRPAPVVIRIYELRAPVAFEAADFFSLFDRDQATLGNDLMTREEIQLRPGDTLKRVSELKPEARVLGVVSAYRDLEHSVWRGTYVLPEPPAATTTPPDRPIVVPVQIVVGRNNVMVSGK